MTNAICLYTPKSILRHVRSKKMYAFANIIVS